MNGFELSLFKNGKNDPVVMHLKRNKLLEGDVFFTLIGSLF